jgi:deoxyhypusine synthase
MLPKDGYIGMSLTGALTPAGLGKSCLIPLMKAGFVDWIISTGANLYHDLHFGLDMQLHSGTPFLTTPSCTRKASSGFTTCSSTTTCCSTPMRSCAK